MSIKPKEQPKKAKELLAEGSYPARCYQIIDLGTQKSVFNGEEKIQRKIRLTWELPNEMRVFSEEKGEQPMTISKKMTLSLHDKSILKPFLKAWGVEITPDFDIVSVIGKPCILSLGHFTNQEGETFATVNGITAPMKGMTIPEQINPSFELSLYEFDCVKFKKLPDFLQEEIAKSAEWIDEKIGEKLLEFNITNA